MPSQASSRKKFYGFIFALTGVFTLVLVIAFIWSSPAMPGNPVHTPAQSQQSCLACHWEGQGGAPLIPHRPMGSCTFCHGAP